MKPDTLETLFRWLRHNRGKTRPARFVYMFGALIEARPNEDAAVVVDDVLSNSLHSLPTDDFLRAWDNWMGCPMPPGLVAAVQAAGKVEQFARANSAQAETDRTLLARVWQSARKQAPVPDEALEFWTPFRARQEPGKAIRISASRILTCGLAGKLQVSSDFSLLEELNDPACLVMLEIEFDTLLSVGARFFGRPRYSI